MCVCVWQGVPTCAARDRRRRGGDDDGATTHVQSRRTVIDWTSLREGDVIFSSARQETHQGIEKKIFLALIDSLFLLIFLLRESSGAPSLKTRPRKFYPLLRR